MLAPVDWRRDVATVDVALHVAGGLAVGFGSTALGGAWGLFSIPALGAFGFGREALQHKNDHPMWNPHRLIEGAAWGVGGVIGAAAGLVFA